MCGEYIAAMRFVEWLQDGQVERAPAMAAVEALLLNDAGIWHYYYSPVCTRVENKEFAIGSGAGEARAAMAAGAPPKLAVAITATIDPSTGGRVRTMSLRQRRG